MIVLVYLLSPVLNVVVSSLSESSFKRLMVGAGLVITVFFAANPFIPEEVYLGHPHGFVWLVYLYLVGAYIKLYLRSASRIIWGAAAGACFALVFLVLWSGFSMNNVSLVSQYSLLPTVLTVAVFVLLKDVKLGALRGLNRRLAECSFGVYLIQEHCLLREPFWSVFNVNHAEGTLGIFTQLLLVILMLWASAFLLHSLYKLLYPTVARVMRKVVSAETR